MNFAYSCFFTLSGILCSLEKKLEAPYPCVINRPLFPCQRLLASSLSSRNRNLRPLNRKKSIWSPLAWFPPPGKRRPVQDPGRRNTERRERGRQHWLPSFGVQKIPQGINRAGCSGTDLMSAHLFAGSFRLIKALTKPAVGTARNATTIFQSRPHKATTRAEPQHADVTMSPIFCPRSCCLMFASLSCFAISKSLSFRLESSVLRASRCCCSLSTSAKIRSGLPGRISPYCFSIAGGGKGP